MKTLKAKQLTRIYGEKELFKNISFLINEHDHIALIGTNGTGKTSLFNVIAGEVSPDSGSFEKPNDYRIGYLKQDPKFDENSTILEAILNSDEKIFQTIKRYETLLQEYSDKPNNKEIFERYLNVQNQMDQQNAWNIESRVKSILNKLKITNLTQKISELSGGQRKRVGLAQVLIQDFDLLLLDEPTNHLDFDSIKWLEEYLNDYQGALLVITHDRYFLDAITTHIFELSFGKLYQYKGNYESFLTQKSKREQKEVETDQKNLKLYKKELDWIKRSPKARSVKQQARVNRFHELEQNLNQAKHEENIEINLSQQRLGKKVLEIKNGYLNFDKTKILDNFNLLVQANDRIGITGINGSGKSTLLNVLANKQPLSNGQLIVGETVKLAYYTQKTEPIPDDKRVINYLNEVGTHITDKFGNVVSTTTLLEQFLFPKFMHGTLIRKLSGGEKRRLYLVKLLMKQPNVLLLDEPTNDLDINTLTVLQDYLNNFVGTVITVSHDRYFLDHVADKLLIFNGDAQIESYSGRLTNYLNKIESKSKNNNFSVNLKSKSQKITKNQKRKLTYAEKIEWDKIEDKINYLEDEKQKIIHQMNQENDYLKLGELQNQLDKLNDDLDKVTKRWDYLSQFVEE
ncbi:MAG: ABC-F family ATP-binding cassette domain-containing protein [Firmicutes bacterium]|uniref:ABC-F family ATP-binding cassette domain-containing protein n=1 Tax=Candidatus Gallilactobacillus intestinavium TaxID=2840838 RepID=A0A9D9E7A1_9LACO|nr:ABC-F family ATP-binding cassette domain-containing protein [Candidatus Gallilactobacillus intestinavium]